MRPRLIPNAAFAAFGAIFLIAIVSSCGGDDDDADEEPSVDETATVVATADSRQAAGADPTTGNQAALDMVLGDYLAANFPDAPTYKGDCSLQLEASCSQFRALDVEGNEYFVIGDPVSFQAITWIVVKQDGDAWLIVADDLSNGWTRDDEALVAPGPCQDVLPEPGSGMPIECLPPATPVTVAGGPRLAGDVLYFPIGQGRWVLGIGLCHPDEEDCGATS